MSRNSGFFFFADSRRKKGLSASLKPLFLLKSVKEKRAARKELVKSTAILGHVSMFCFESIFFIYFRLKIDNKFFN